ncbi:MAG: hypothetical protein MAG794_01555 [Gammaproteobacteria bacterium]|nr:hypothetical protein [Gammaproteobacteria bacterium]
MQGLSRPRNLCHETGGGLEIPVGVGDMDMTQVRTQCGHVVFDRLGIATALFQRANGESVAQIVEARTGMAGSGP